MPQNASVDGLRLALSVDLGCYAVDAEVEAATRAAASALARAGADVEEVELDWNREVADAWRAHWGVYLAAMFGDKLSEYRERMDPNVVALMDAGLRMSAVEFKRLEFIRTEQWHKFRPILDRYDGFLCPTMARPAPPVDEDDSRWREDWGDGRYHGLLMTGEFSCVSQCPALSVPSGWNSQGLPIGIQIVARRYRDDTALRIGAALERMRPWAHRRPQV